MHSVLEGPILVDIRKLGLTACSRATVVVEPVRLLVWRDAVVRA
jgi:hypothetical protein